MGFKWIKWMFFVVWVWVLDLLCGGWWLWGKKKKQFPRGWETAFAI